MPRRDHGTVPNRSTWGMITPIVAKRDENCFEKGLSLGEFCGIIEAVTENSAEPDVTALRFFISATWFFYPF